MTWPRSAQRVLWVAAALLFLLTMVPVLRGEHTAKPFVPAAAMPRLDLRISLNRASAAELEALPALGPALAAAIVSHREQHGPFRYLDDLKAVPGVRDATVGKWETYLTLD